MDDSQRRVSSAAGSHPRTARLVAITAVFSLLLLLGALEGGLRVYHRLLIWNAVRTLPPLDARAMIPSRDPELVYEWNPGFTKNGFHVNALGMADRDGVSREKPAGTIRIAFTGDSLTANFEHRPTNEIYLRVLERALDGGAQSGGRVEALNFGVNGYSLLQSLRMLEARALGFDPDVVVAQLCLNDPYPSYGPYTQQWPPGPSRLWNFILRRIAPDRFWALTFVERAYDATGIASLRRGIAGLAEVAHGGPPVLAVLFPYLYEPAYAEWDFARYHEIYRAAAADAGLALLDLREAFRNGGISVGPYPADAIHPSREGHALAAAEILAELERRGWLSRARQDRRP